MLAVPLSRLRRTYGCALVLVSFIVLGGERLWLQGERASVDVPAVTWVIPSCRNLHRHRLSHPGSRGMAVSTAIRAASGGSSATRSHAAALEALEALRRGIPATPTLRQSAAAAPQRPASTEGVRRSTEPVAAPPAMVEVVGAGSAMGSNTAVSSAAQTSFSRIYKDEEWGVEARSGLGSREDTTREIRPFLENFLRERGIKSVVDAGCGHWPSGYQRFMNWQGVHYTGIDVVPFVVEENRRYFSDAEHLQQHGLASAQAMQGDVSSELPGADLLIVKDVLMHLPNSAISTFIRNNINIPSPRYRAVLLVQNEVPHNFRTMMDIEPGQLLPFDITAPPFDAPFKTIFRWRSDEPKAVQIFEAE